ncbi:chromatin modification-related protein EAF1 B-like isoform X1 [Primulina huaijiensis]|uniref:chromatin modification-related protein EAF1 B-like isoform X1 n=1 Tax=Primulina huaijiensis TaxID=1492673 RepID=UPI003CC77700
MGGILEGGVGIANKSSPHRASIENVQAELRKEYDVREERKRELEFLEKGGNPLDFNLGNAASVSVQSTSFTNLQHDLVTSEPKDSFAFTASLYGDSVESSGRLAAAVCEPNSADNLMLLDAEHEYSEGDRNSFHPIRGNVVPPEQSSERDGSHKTREHGDSSAFGLPRKAYKRRYRSRSNRDGARSGSSDVNPELGSHGSFLPSHHGPGNVIGTLSDVENLDVSSNCNSKPGRPKDGTLCPDVCVDDHQFVELNDARAVGSTEDLIKGVSSHSALVATASKNPLGHNKPSLPNAATTPMKKDCNEPAVLQSMEEMASAVVEHQPRAATGKVENHGSCQMNGFVNKKGDAITNDAHNGNAARHGNGFDSESCSQTNLDVDRNNDTETGTKISTIDSNGDVDNQNVGPEDLLVRVRETKEAKLIDNFSVDEESASACLNRRQNGPPLPPQEEKIQGRSLLLDKLTNQSDISVIEAGGCSGSESGKKPTVPLVENSSPQSEIFTVTRNSIADLAEAGSSSKVSTISFDVQTPGNLKLASVDEESILKEAESIEAKRKRLAELSTLTLPSEIPRKSHWDYVLEEMAWLANDFAQERIWKLAASSQICNRAAISSRVRKQEKSSSMKAKMVARTLARAVMEFWHSVEEISKELEQPSQKDALQSYMARFLKYNNSNVLHYQTDVQLTLDKVSDSGILDMSWEDSLTEENLFYAIPLGAMVTYKKSIESLVAHYERIGSDVREEVETSGCDLVADNSYYEDDGDTCTFGMPMASDDGKFSKFGQKKRKFSAHAYGAREYGIGSDYLPMHISENKIVTQQSSFLAKRPGSNLNVSIPTKRMRTASRRILSPFSAGTSGCIQLPNKTDASSGDTNSFQDDQSSLHGGSSFPINLEVESCGEFEKNLAFDSAEVSTKPKKKKKKVKHPTSAFEQRWQIDSNFHNDQRDHSKKRSDSYQLESNGCNGILGQPMMKKSIQPSQDGSFDNTSTVAGHVPSPVASQMSNMYHPNKFYKMLGGRERGRKAKTLKMPPGQPQSDSRTPWSLFEDQALVVMVHDMGPNWELVSDAFNSTMQFKCIFRNAKECKERHNILMDKTSADGAESAEDSGSSQPYPSTLPGIPKGSARQLFQHLKEPMEEDTLRSHREKIILIGQKLRYHKTQDPKQLQPPHSSHTMALSQVCPNNMGGGSVLSPLDLCDANVSGTDIPSLGHQGTYSSGLIISNQSAGAPTHPTSGASSALQGSSNMMLGNNFPSSPGPLSSVRDGRYGAPRPASPLIDEQQRIQQYNQMVSGRNGQQSNLSSSGALPGIDRGVRVPPSGSGMGMVCISGSMPMARHGLHGVASSSSVNSGSMVSANMHPGVRSGPGNSSLRPREGSPMMRPGLSQDSQRQMMTPDLQIQVSPGSNQVMSHFGGLNSPFTNQTVSSPVSSYPLHHQQSHQISSQQAQVPSPRHPHFQGLSNHASNPQQQAYAIRLAKERQLQQRFLQQQPPQQQQFAASNSSIPHVQPQSHLPASSAVQNNPLVQSPANSPSVSVSPMTSPSSVNAMSQQQQKHHTPTQGVIRNTQTGCGVLTNQTSKQRQKQQQPFIQTNRQHPQQRQQSQSPQQAKGVKGVGRGNMMIHQNIQIDPTILNGSLTEAQDSYTGSSVNAVPPTRQYTSSQLSNQPLPQQKKYSGQSSSSSKHLQQMISHSDTNQGHVPPVAPAPCLPAARQSVTPLATASSNHPQVMHHQKFMNQSQSALQKVVQSNHQFSSEAMHKAHPPVCNSTEMEATTSLPLNQWHTSEPVNESNVLNSETSLGSFVSKPANLSETTLQSSQGHGQRLSSANLIPITHDVSSQWQRQQQQQPQVQHSHSPSPSPQQQSQIHQAGNAKFYGTPDDSRLE